MRITLRLMLDICYPASFLFLGIFLLQFEPSPKEEVLNHKDVKEIIAEEGWRGFMS
ncbi:MAG: hypothetical protein R8P61_29850 [Bacteroidia bacterium]|nr:hypothetical protein [Bacteroidia bacterium]